MEHVRDAELHLSPTRTTFNLICSENQIDMFHKVACVRTNFVVVRGRIRGRAHVVGAWRCCCESGEFIGVSFCREWKSFIAHHAAALRAACEPTQDDSNVAGLACPETACNVLFKPSSVPVACCRGFQTDACPPTSAKQCAARECGGWTFPESRRCAF